MLWSFQYIMLVSNEIQLHYKTGIRSDVCCANAQNQRIVDAQKQIKTFFAWFIIPGKIRKIQNEECSKFVCILQQWKSKLLPPAISKNMHWISCIWMVHFSLFFFFFFCATHMKRDCRQRQQQRWTNAANTKKKK